MILLLALCGSIVSLSAQIEQYAIGSLGGQIANNDYELIHSIGDVAGTSIGSDPQLVQGFPQCFACDDCLPLDIEELYANPLIKVYPNPTTGLLQLAGESRLMYRYELYGVNGQRLRTDNLSLSHIDISDLNSGIYLLRVYGRDGTLSFLGKVAKE